MIDFLRYMFIVMTAQILLLVIYRLVLKELTFFRLNRFVLLLTLILPFFHPIMKAGFPASTSYLVNLDPVYFLVDQPVKAETSSLSVAGIILWIYIAGCTWRATVFLWQIARIRTLISKGDKVKLDDEVVWVQLPEARAAFSFHRWIFTGSAHSTDELDRIICHERAHVRQHHTLDLVLISLLTVFCWFNPVIWLIRAEIRLVHEYLADEDAAGREQLTGYLNGLLAGAMLVPTGMIISEFSYFVNLKNRIHMLKKRRTKAHHAMKYLLIVPAVAAMSYFSACTRETSHTAGITQVEGVEMKPDVMPEFKGGNEALITWLTDNLVYPESARESGEEGTVHVSFVVNEDGQVEKPAVVKSISTALDAEALRVIGAMPAWTPGMKYGKKVKVEYTIPVAFRL